MSAVNDLLEKLSTETPLTGSPASLPKILATLHPEEILPFLTQLDSNPGLLSQTGFQNRMLAILPRLTGICPEDSAEKNRIAGVLARVFRHTATDAPIACGWLMWIASLATENALELWSHELTERPPQVVAALPWAFAPVLNLNTISPAVTTRLFEAALGDPVLAPAILDTFNFRFRKRLSVPHPAADWAPRLNRLLTAMVQGMTRVEEGMLPAGETPAEISANINNSVSTVVALCDTLGLCRYGQAEGALLQALDLKHRRIQTEAAGALARMDHNAGHEALVRLASEPVARLRVLAYAEEMNLLGRIPAAAQSETARAESQLAIWLAEPAQMGMAPTRITNLDQRTLFWPGYDNPVECFLFRFEYGSQYSSIGIVGPCVHALAAGSAWMTVPDMLAAFAGWQAEHPELYYVSGADFAAGHAAALDDFLQRLEEAGFENVMLQLAGHLFGQWVPVATAVRDGRTGTVVLDGAEPHWYPDPEEGEIDPELVWTTELGRRLLRNFNPDAGF